MFLWRISKFADLTGKGGEVVSGRWHEKGNPIVYCADHPSTALLEMIVHLNPANIPDKYQLLKVHCPDSVFAKPGYFTPGEQNISAAESRTSAPRRADCWSSSLLEGQRAKFLRP
jgi:hypothetical protein